MKKFWVLIQKEIREMLTLQTLAPMIVTVLIFVFIGNTVGKEMEKTKNVQDIIVLDNDNSTYSRWIVDVLNKSNFKVSLLENKSEDEAISYAKEKKIAGAIVLPENFEQNVENGISQKINAYAILRNFSYTGAKDTAVLDSAVAIVNDLVGNQILSKKLHGVDSSVIKAPIQRNDYVVVGDKKAEADPTQVMAFVTSQTTFIPIILFLVIILAATMIATAIATEKENKTLETLLTTPVDRKYIVSAKMIGAGVVALLSALVYLYGLSRYMGGLSGGSLNSSGLDNIKEVASSLGLVFDTTGYLILGATLFLGILCALAIATIIGAFAEDAKSVSGLISPLMVLIMIPYFLTLFLNPDSFSPALKALVYAIPFSYPFMAAPNIFLHNYSVLFYGIAYQIIFFLIFVYIASRIFSTDRIITMKLNFSKNRSK